MLKYNYENQEIIQINDLERTQKFKMNVKQITNPKKLIILIIVVVFFLGATGSGKDGEWSNSNPRLVRGRKAGAGCVRAGSGRPGAPGGHRLRQPARVLRPPPSHKPVSHNSNHIN